MFTKKEKAKYKTCSWKETKQLHVRYVEVVCDLQTFSAACKRANKDKLKKKIILTKNIGESTAGGREMNYCVTWLFQCQ